MPCCKEHLPCWLGGGACNAGRQKRDGERQTERERYRQMEIERESERTKKADKVIETVSE